MASSEQRPTGHSGNSKHSDSSRHSGGERRSGGQRGDGRGQTGGVPDGLLVGLLALLLGLTLFTWTATGLAALFSHGAWPDGVDFTRTPNAMRALATEPHDIAGAWPAARPGTLSGYGLFWGIFISQMLVVLVLTIFTLGTLARARAVRAARRAARRAAQTEQGPSGSAPVSPSSPPAGRRGGPVPEAEPEPKPEPEPEPEGPLDLTKPAQAPPAEADPPATEPAQATSPPVAAPGLGTPGPGASGSALSATASASASGSSPASASGPGSGDPYARVHDAPGAALVATRDPLLWAGTKDARAKLGPVHVFDPGHLCDTPDRLRWSPHHGCADRQTAVARATAMLEPLRSWRPPRPVDADVHSAAETLLRCWLHAAALDNRPFREVHRWAQSTKAATDPVQTLRTHPEAAPGSAGELESLLTGHPERRGSATALVRRALAPLSQLHVRNACSAGRADRIALDSFIHETGTLYVVAADPEIMPLVNALARSVADEGRRIARASAARLDPPLTEILELTEAP